MPKTREIPVRVRDLIVDDYEDKENGPKSYQTISDKWKIPRSTVQSIIKKHKITGTTRNLSGRGRKPTFDERATRKIIRKVNENPRITSSKLAAEINSETGSTPHPSTVRKLIRNNGMKSHYAVKKPFINKKNQMKRLAFAKKHINEPESFWRKVLWSDESKFNIFASDGRSRVWRKNGEALKLRNLNATVKHGGGSVMLWGSMAYSGVGNFEFIEGIMTKEVYLAILKRNLRDSARKLSLGRQFVFQEDNDPKHTSKLVQSYIKKERITRLDWPPFSPDLNPIEHLWDVLGREVRKVSISSKQQLKDRLTHVWSNLKDDVTKNLVNSMPRRLQAVIEAKGGPTKY